MMNFDISKITNAESFAFSAENPTGARAGGSKGGACEKLNPFAEIKPGETLTIADISGPGKIQSIWMTGTVTWNMVIRMYWDGCEYPSVEAPLGAFFGFGYSNTAIDKLGNFPTLTSAMIMVAPNRGMSCYWPMPFKKGCKITVENRSPSETHVLYYMITGEHCDIPEECGYFHASYRQAHPIAAGDAYTVIDGIEGRGHFVGCALFAGLNGNNGCWVEGEAKMYIDDDKYPSINYTGTEDYFCGAYAFGYDSRVEKYQPYSGHYAGMYACIGGDHFRYEYQPRFMLYRWHVPDPIHFKKNFKMTLQNMHFTPHGHKGRRDDYASTAYWYQTIPAKVHPIPSDEEIDMT